MTKTGNVLIGAVIGGAAGYVIGAIIADYVAPEYYTDEELEQLDDLIEDLEYKVAGEPKEDLFSIPVKKEIVERPEKVDYTKYYQKPDDDKNQRLSNLANLANRLTEDRIMDDKAEDTYSEEEEDEFMVIDHGPQLDFHNLQPEDEDDYLYLRDTDDVHVLTEAEYYSNEDGRRQVLLKYFPDDDVLASEDDRPVESMEKVVGPYALDNFGVFTDEPNVVFVSNPKLNANYKVVNMGGSYEEKVLGAQKKVVVRRNVFDDAEGEEDGFNR